jgi:hypothetical protein
MSAATSCVGAIRGATGSGKALVLWSGLPAGAELQILHRIDRGGIRVGERELRYQLECKDNHPLASEDVLLDVLAELEARGLLEAELCFRLTTQGRDRLTGGGERFAVREDGAVVCARCVREAKREGAGVIVDAWIDAGLGVCCEWCGAGDLPTDGEEG